MQTDVQAQPSVEKLFNTINAFQVSAALKAAVDLGVFTAVGEGLDTPAAIAARVGASERGGRILCDFLAIQGLLAKSEGRYGPTPESAAFLDTRSETYMGGTLRFMLSEQHVAQFFQLGEAVRQGGATAGREVVETDHPMWVEFARSMAPLMRQPAAAMAEMADTGQPMKILDVAAGHGTFGIAFARRNPQAEVVALDWPHVLEVARENAEAAGVADRWRAHAGSAFDVDFGTDYDLVLLTNFLHHFDAATNVQLLRKIRAALKAGGRVLTLEFVPNPDRVTPKAAAAFSLTMLAVTPSGDAYTFAEIAKMFQEAGFPRSQVRSLEPGPQTVIISER